MEPFGSRPGAKTAMTNHQGRLERFAFLHFAMLMMRLGVGPRWQRD